MELNSIFKSNYNVNNISVDEYKEIINILIDNIKERLPYLKNKKQFNSLINDLELLVNNIDSINQDNINLLNKLIKRIKGINYISKEDKVYLFMSYINDNDIPNQNSNIRFCDIGNNDDATIIGKWFISKIYQDNDFISNEINKYKDIYNNAYNKIVNKLNSINEIKNISNKTKEEIINLLEYLNDKNNNNLDIRFSDIGLNSNTNINQFIRNNIYKNYNSFISIIEDNKDKYNIGYNRLMDIINNKVSKIKLDDNSRMNLFMMYVEKNGLPTTKDLICFNDLDNRYNDYSIINNWFNMFYNTNDYNDVIKVIDRYKDMCPKAYNIIINNIDKRINNKINNLSFYDKLDIYMKYINDNDIPEFSSKITWNDIDNSINQKYLVYRWSIYSLFNNYERIEYTVERYEDIYPKAVIKLLNRVEEANNKKKEIIYNKISYEDRIKLLYYYVNLYKKAPSEYREISFKNLDNNIDDKTNIGNWFKECLRNNPDKFIIMCNKYKDKYPIEYNIIYNRYLKYLDRKVKKLIK